MATAESILDGRFDEDWELSREVDCGVETDDSYVARGYECQRKAAHRAKETVEVQLLRVSMELNLFLRGVMRFKDDDEGEDESDADIDRKESELSERFREIREIYMEVKCSQMSEVRVLLSVGKQLREVGLEWKEYSGEYSSLKDEDMLVEKNMSMESEWAWDSPVEEKNPREVDTVQHGLVFEFASGNCVTSRKKNE
jgi:hypothetical protein